MTTNGANQGGVTQQESGNTTATTNSFVVPANKAYLHANLWNKFHNFRSFCGTEKSFLWMCENIKAEQVPNLDCSAIKSKYESCLATNDQFRFNGDGSNNGVVEYGFVGYEKNYLASESLCSSAIQTTCTLPTGAMMSPTFQPLSAPKSDGTGSGAGCDYRCWDFTGPMRFHWYGPKWADNYGVTTMKIFRGIGKDQYAFKGSDEIIGLSNIQNTKERGSSGVDKGGKRIGSGCALTQDSDPNNADPYRAAFGAFAWVEVPIGSSKQDTANALTVTASQGVIFGGSFDDFGREHNSGPVKTLGQSTESYWLANPPDGGRRVGYSTYTEEIIFEGGKQYYLGHGSIREVDKVPQDIIDAFKMVNPTLDIAKPTSCQ